MSITGQPNQAEKIYRKSIHRRNDSGTELDVFEASNYFSGYNEALNNGTTKTTTLNHKIMKEENTNWSGGRISLDLPMRNILNSHHDHQQSHNDHMVEKQTKEKKFKQPSSPGGKLASFLNSLFNQSASKKKKSKSTTLSMKDHEEEISPSGRRRRRISISHFRSSSSSSSNIITTNTNADSKSLYSCSSSGFRTPPPNAETPIKSYKDFRSTYSDHKEAFSFPKYNGNIRSDEVFDGKREKGSSWLDQKLKCSNGLSEKFKNLSNNTAILDKDMKWVNKYETEEREFRRFNEVDDGAESDSSSDLFELPNFDLGCYSSGLPVYETTNMDKIKRVTQISNAQL